MSNLLSVQTPAYNLNAVLYGLDRLLDDSDWSNEVCVFHARAERRALTRTGRDRRARGFPFQSVTEYIQFPLLKYGSNVRLRYQKEAYAFVDCDATPVLSTQALGEISRSMLLPAVSEGDQGPVLNEHDAAFRMYWNKPSLPVPWDGNQQRRSLLDDMKCVLQAVYTLNEKAYPMVMENTIRPHPIAGWNGQLKNSLKTKYQMCVVVAVYSLVFGSTGGLENCNSSLLQIAGGPDTEMGQTVLHLLKLCYKCFNSESWGFPLGRNSSESDIVAMASTVLKHRINKFLNEMESHGVWNHVEVARLIGQGFDDIHDAHCTKGAYLPLVKFLMKTNGHVRTRVMSMKRKYQSDTATPGDRKKFQYLTANERSDLFDPNNSHGTNAFVNLTPRKRSGGRFMNY